MVERVNDQRVLVPSGEKENAVVEFEVLNDDQTGPVKKRVR